MADGIIVGESFGKVLNRTETRSLDISGASDDKQRLLLVRFLGRYPDHQVVSESEFSTFCETIDRFKEKLEQRNVKSVLTLQLVSEWIYNTHAIEQFSTRDCRETLNAITDLIGSLDPGSGGGSGGGSKNTKDLMNGWCERRKAAGHHFLLLKDTFHPGDQTPLFRAQHILDWHGRLCIVGSDPGRYRRCQVCVKTRSTPSATYLFPDSLTVPSDVELLCKTQRKLMCAIRDTVANPLERMYYMFALAAFVQYHFVSIHPFRDGNGRMCRLVHKILLDSVLPLPVCPDNRDAYIDAIEQGRTLAFDHWVPLFRLFMSEIQKQYSFWLLQPLPEKIADAVIVGSGPLGKIKENDQDSLRRSDSEAPDV